MKLYNKQATTNPELIFKLLTMGYRTEMKNNTYSIYGPVSKRISMPDTNPGGSSNINELMKVFQVQMSSMATGAEEWVLAQDVDRAGFEEYAYSLIKEYDSRPQPLLEIGTMVRHKNGFGVLHYDTKGLILDRDYDIQNRTFYYLIEYYASYVSPMTENKTVAVKMNTWIPENTLIKEPFSTDVESVAKLLD